MADDDVPLREYFEALREADQRAITAALIAQKGEVASALVAAEKAVLKAELAADKRFEAVNAFRQTLTDQASTFATREKVDGIENRLSLIEGAKTGVTSAQALVFSLVGVLAIAVSIFVALAR